MKVSKVNVQEFRSNKKTFFDFIKLSINTSFIDGMSDEIILERINKLENFIKEDLAIVYGAWIDKQLVGFVWCHTINRLTETRIHISSIVVDEKFQNLGVASKLLDEVEKFCRANQYGAIDLLVTSQNLQAINFYKKRNFEIERFQMFKHL